MDMNFVAVLSEMNNGHTVDDLTQALRHVANAVKLTRKAGSVTLKVNLKPAEKADGDVVFLRDEIKLNVPEPDRASKIFYIDEDNNLVREDPRQKRMFDEDRSR